MNAEMFKATCCKQCRQVKFKGPMTKLPLQNKSRRTAQNTKKQQK